MNAANHNPKAERPAAFQADLANLPDALAPLKELQNWIVWKWEWRVDKRGVGKWTKPPYQPKRPRKYAKNNDPSTWATHEEALAAFNAGGFDGIGFNLLGTEFAAFDLDKCRDPNTGAIAKEAMAIVDRAASYTEMTVSGTGLRVIGFGDGSEVHHKKQKMPGCSVEVETYSNIATGRYIVVSGNPLPGTWPHVEDITRVVADVVAELGGGGRAADPDQAEFEPEPEADAEDDVIDFGKARRQRSAAFLPDWLGELIEKPLPPDADHSEQFYKAVAALWGRGWSADDIEGYIADKPIVPERYRHRLRKQIDACSTKAQAKAEAKARAEAEAGAGAPGANSEDDIEELNKVYAVVPIGGKNRVVKFGESADFRGHETIVERQTFEDFKALNDKYRRTWLDEKGNLKTVGLGTLWIKSEKRRQYDGGMAFMPQHDGDLGGRLNLWRGFGVKPAKPEGKSGAAGCAKFLDFGRKIICSGNEEHFDYLLKREAFIVQRRARSEIALGLRTTEEGCGKGFYEATMRHLLGTHAMQATLPKHIIGNFNPHLENLLRLTADEALFARNPEHRNVLFGLITEPTLTIEPKGCGVYTAASYQNISILSNEDHFVPVSGTARRFFIPTVSAARKQDFEYFAGLDAELKGGGYEALLYHLLHEVDLRDFNVRDVPQTEALRQQRDLSLPPLESWWAEILDAGTLSGADPDAPHRAVSNAYQRRIDVEVKAANIYGNPSTQVRFVNQPGVYDQARQIEPRLKNGFFSDHRLGSFLASMGCDNTHKVLRRRGWTFPPLADCRDKWGKRYPHWKWKNPSITAWWAEEPDGE